MLKPQRILSLLKVTSQLTFLHIGERADSGNEDESPNQCPYEKPLTDVNVNDNIKC
jgi:hypothetical protein